MSERLPETHYTAVIGRLCLLLAACALIAASVMRPPRLIYSYHAEHFVAFYVLSLCAGATFKTTRVLILGWALAGFALLFESARSFSPYHATTTYLDWVADAAGIVAALAPMLVQKHRRRF